MVQQRELTKIAFYKSGTLVSGNTYIITVGETWGAAAVVENWAIVTGTSTIGVFASTDDGATWAPTITLSSSGSTQFIYQPLAVDGGGFVANGFKFVYNSDGYGNSVVLSVAGR